jgi:hypothetical protein
LTVDLDPVGSESKLSAEEYQLGQRVVSNFEQILKFWLFDRDIVSKVSEVIKDTTKCDNPILLHHLPTFLKLLTVAFNASHQSCFLSGAASIMAHSTTQLISNSKNVYEQCSVQIVTIFAEKCSSMASMEQDPDVPFEFFEFYIHVLKKLPQSIQSLNESLCRTLFLHCLVQGLELQEQMSIQAILKFLREFVAMGYENSPLEHFTKNILVLIGAPIIRQIIKVRLINKGIGGGHPSSLVPKLGQTLFQFFVFFPVATQEGMIACLQEPDFPSRKVNDVEKQAFIKSLAGIRKVKLFNDTVRAFSAKCRGL